METFPLAKLRRHVAALAAKGIYIGTSSWKYEGWLDQIYTRERYLKYFKSGPPKHLKGQFEKTCLQEYAETFKTVCLDGAFYQYPSPEMLDGHFSQLPLDFKLSMKVTDDVTVFRYPHRTPRYRDRAGQINENFLDPERFKSLFLGPLTPYQDRIGTIIFEFGHIRPADLVEGRDFVAALDSFFASLPRGWNYSVEVRNEALLQPAYFEMLKQHDVAHTFNSWARMPPVGEQIRLAGDRIGNFSTARFLLRPGRSYDEAVDSFSPYERIQDPYPEGREALVYLLRQATTSTSRKYYLYINNRFEGSAPWTIVHALADMGL